MILGDTRFLHALLPSKGQTLNQLLHPRGMRSGQVSKILSIRESLLSCKNDEELLTPTSPTARLNLSGSKAKYSRPLSLWPQEIRGLWAVPMQQSQVTATQGEEPGCTEELAWLDHWWRAGEPAGNCTSPAPRSVCKPPLIFPVQQKGSFMRVEREGRTISVFSCLPRQNTAQTADQLSAGQPHLSRELGGRGWVPCGAPRLVPASSLPPAPYVPEPKPCLQGGIWAAASTAAAGSGRKSKDLH